MSWYQSRPVYVQAKRCTPETAKEVALWCGGEVVNDPKPSDPTDVRIYVKVPVLGGEVHAEATMKGGYYVTKGEDGRFGVMDPDDFEKKFIRALKEPHSD